MKTRNFQTSVKKTVITTC